VRDQATDHAAQSQTFKEEVIVKRIILVRHATAVKKDPAASDFDRVLRKSGRKEARDMSKRLRDVESKPALFVSSSAPRALDTAKIFARAFDCPAKKIERSEELYEVTSRELLRLVKALDDAADSVMLFGHDPTFTEFARHLLPDLKEPMPKCGVVGIAVDVDTWAKVTPKVSKKEYVLHPPRQPSAKVLQKELRRQLGAEIENNIASTLSDFGIDDNAEVRRELQRFSAKLAKRLAPQARTGQSTDKPSAAPGPGHHGEK
jgi:phosphohistidine phosphatase